MASAESAELLPPAGLLLLCCVRDFSGRWACSLQPMTMCRVGGWGSVKTLFSLSAFKGKTTAGTSQFVWDHFLYVHSELGPGGGTFLTLIITTCFALIYPSKYQLTLSESSPGQVTRQQDRHRGTGHTCGQIMDHLHVLRVWEETVFTDLL